MSGADMPASLYSAQPGTGEDGARVCALNMGSAQAYAAKHEGKTIQFITTPNAKKYQGDGRAKGRRFLVRPKNRNSIGDAE